MFQFFCSLAFKTVGTVLMRASFPVEWSSGKKAPDVDVSKSEIAFWFCFLNLPVLFPDFRSGIL